VPVFVFQFSTPFLYALFLVRPDLLDPEVVAAITSALVRRREGGVGCCALPWAKAGSFAWGVVKKKPPGTPPA
jgi:hypothetical protein